MTAGFGAAVLGAGDLAGITTSVRTGALAMEYGGASFNSNGGGAAAGATASFATGATATTAAAGATAAAGCF